MKQTRIVLLVALVLSGCGLDRLGLIGHTEQLKADAAAAERKCDEIGTADDPKLAIARAKCQTQAWAILRPAAPHPDLLDTLIAKRLAIAEQVEKGQLTTTQANEQVAKMQRELKDEEDRRLKEKRSVITQPAASTRAGEPANKDSANQRQPLPCQKSGECY